MVGIQPKIVHYCHMTERLCADKTKWTVGKEAQVLAFCQSQLQILQMPTCDYINTWYMYTLTLALVCMYVPYNIHGLIDNIGLINTNDLLSTCPCSKHGEDASPTSYI